MARRDADLNPPLGFPGGPCQVVERIEDKVRAPRLREDLSEKVEHGEKLTNPEAAKIYTLDSEKGGPGLFKALKITPHAQYRMDQRGVTVRDLRVSLNNYSRQLNDWKSRKDWQWEEFQRNTMRREPIEWNDKKLADLRIVFVNEDGTAVIITTFWVGEPDPHAESCGLHPRHAGITPETDSGARTMVKDPKPQESDTGKSEKSDGKYPDRGLPYPRWKNRISPQGPSRYNVPGWSGSNSDGTIHKDKVRTKGTPGGQYDNDKTHPTPDVTDSQITPHRRPSMAAGGPEDDWFVDDAPPNQEVYDEFDSFDEEENLITAAGYKPKFNSPHPPGNMQEHKQKGQVYRYDAKRYKRKRGRIKRMVMRRYRRLNHNHRFMARREWAKEAPARHKRKPGGGARTIAERSKRQREKAKQAAFSVEIPFFHYPTEEWGTLYEVTPDGAVTYELGGEQGVTDFDTFFDEVVVEEEHLDEVFDYLDGVFEFDPTAPEDAEETDEADELFDTWWESHGIDKVGLTLHQRPVHRRHRQRGQARRKSQIYYRQNRTKARLKSRQRYKRLKNNPTFKKQQSIRRKHPERFKMLRSGFVLTAPDIAFVMDRGDGQLPLGYVRNVSGMTSLVQFWLMEPGHRLLQAMPVSEFLDVVVFLSPQDEDAMFELIDSEVGLGAYEDVEDGEGIDDTLVNLFVIESEFMHEQDRREEDSPEDPYLIDPEDEEFYYGAVNKLAQRVVADFLREQRPPDMDPETKFDRGTSPDKAKDDRKKERRKHPGDNFYPYMDEVHDSNPGSRVLPGPQKDHVQRQAKFNYRSLPHDCKDGLHSLIHSPLWRKFRQGLISGKKVLEYLQEHGWDTLSEDGMWELFNQAATAKLARQAALIREIREGNSADLLSRSQGLKVKLSRVDQKNGVWLFNVEGSKEPYRVRLKASRQGNVRDIQKLHVKVSCSCAFWQWQGPEHWAKQGDYLFGKPRGLATRPDVKDPNGQHRACKHVLAVLTHITDRPSTQLRPWAKQARYLVDTLRLGEMVAEYPQFEQSVRRVAARYLASQEVRDA